MVHLPVARPLADRLLVVRPLADRPLADRLEVEAHPLLAAAGDRGDLYVRGGPSTSLSSTPNQDVRELGALQAEIRLENLQQTIRDR